MNKLLLLGLTAIYLMVAGDVLAAEQSLGKEFYCDTVKLITGSIGTMMGLLIALLGLMVFSLSGKVGGIIVMIVGVSVTAFPGIFEGFLSGMSAFTSGDDNKVFELSKSCLRD